MQGKKNKQKIVQQYDINGMLINEYKNVLEASRITTVKFHSIYACCHNKCKTGYGFIWKYKVE